MREGLAFVALYSWCFCMLLAAHLFGHASLINGVAAEAGLGSGCVGLLAQWTGWRIVDVGLGRTNVAVAILTSI